MNPSEKSFGLAQNARSGLAVVVPMFNERTGAARCVNEISNILDSLTRPGVLVVVDDGSSDGTSALLEELGKTIRVLRVVHHDTNLGYGAALRTGTASAAAAGAEWVLFMDSDLTNPPKDIDRFVAVMAPDVDYIKASRYVSGGVAEGVPFGRRVVSRAGNAFARRLFGLELSDITNGFRAIRIDALLQMPLQETGFSVIVEEVFWAQKLGLRSTEIGTVLSNRRQGRSSFSYGPKAICAYAQYPVRTFAERQRKRIRELVRGRDS